MRLRLACWLTAAWSCSCAVPVAPPELQPPLETWGPPVEVQRFDAAGRPLGPESVPTILKNPAAWQARLGVRSYAVLRQGATEPPFSSPLAQVAEQGVYVCRGCGLELFAAAAQFDSPTGWPSFTAPLSGRNIVTGWDRSWGMQRRAVRCVRCGGRLGHVFGDGPAPTYKRYCLNGAALRLVGGDSPGSATPSGPSD
ncbi:MAG: peptide-methionine (R)-S-oxide reductase MsrB [Acidobacteria bacterium]|nr:peptide-methionine (R)-S-oxide reductase MsrB [Acidobacteriota bacterium]